MRACGARGGRASVHRRRACVCGSVGEPCGLIGRDPARLTARSARSGAAWARSERGERMHDRGASGGVGACPVRWLGV